MPPPFEVLEVRDTGPTDNSGLDTLYVVHMSEGAGAAERFIFSVLQRQGQPDEEELEALIRLRAAGFANDRSALQQFRELEKPWGRPDRMVIALHLPDDD
jgi:hypothetical protein